MPTYDYKCEKCGNKFDVYQHINDKSLEICKKCGGSLKKFIGSGTGIIFKGKGFYQTDYKHKNISNQNNG